MADSLSNFRSLLKCHFLIEVFSYHSLKITNPPNAPFLGLTPFNIIIACTYIVVLSMPDTHYSKCLTFIKCNPHDKPTKIFIKPILLLRKLRPRQVQNFPNGHIACKWCSLDPRLFNSRNCATILQYHTDLFIYIIYFIYFGYCVHLSLKYKLFKDMDFCSVFRCIP